MMPDAMALEASTRPSPRRLRDEFASHVDVNSSHVPPRAVEPRGRDRRLRR